MRRAQNVRFWLAALSASCAPIVRLVVHAHCGKIQDQRLAEIATRRDCWEGEVGPTGYSDFLLWRSVGRW
jgi:hypothetical protein